MTKPLNAPPPAVPKQKRSLESQEAILLATERLLTREGGNDFTLLDLSRESGMSVGGIYRRFVDKQGLMLVMQQRLNERMLQDYTEFAREASQSAANLKQLVPVLIAGMTELLRRHAAVLRKIVEESMHHPEMAQNGIQIYHAHLALFKRDLLRYRAEIAHDDPEYAIEFCFNAVYELVASHLAFGRGSTVTEQDWPRLLANLQRLCLNFLAYPL
ncbi:TetR family transcriptional regulator [Duganella sp. FT80W]|uniref:TetR family transcriptional regulator n=1 Tax=Duganella guangzhouensis TaxID=2666084 RepID=A0A6I2L709_9BURK|nr:TetR/AcrR family transcriptional regulator [Duganella guangzhouensis]MRW92069.1 TetR family transcriptional regulator [Duganella guangzhouensis]